MPWRGRDRIASSGNSNAMNGSDKSSGGSNNAMNVKCKVAVVLIMQRKRRDKY